MKKKKYTPEQLIDLYFSYMRVVPPDPERTICLISAAKGDRSNQSFAEAVGTSKVSIGRILSGKTVKIGQDILSGIANAADKTWPVDRDILMEAQGWVYGENFLQFSQRRMRAGMQVIEDEFLSCGRLLQKMSPLNNQYGYIMHIRGDDDAPMLWKFTPCLAPFDEPHAQHLSEACAWRKIAQMPGDEDRHSLVVENKEFFDLLVKKFSEEKCTKWLSVILVSVPQRKVADEYILPNENDANPQGIMGMQRKFEPLPSYPLMDLYTGDPNEIIPQLNRIDFRRIIADAVFKKMVLFRYKAFDPNLSSIPDITPDVLIAYYEPGGEEKCWWFDIKSFPNRKDNTEAQKEIDDWLTKILAFSSLNSTISRFTLAIDNWRVYHAALKKLKDVTLPVDISLLRIAPLDFCIKKEFRIPLISGGDDRMSLI